MVDTGTKSPKLKRSRWRGLTGVAALPSLALVVVAAGVDVSKLPPPTSQPVDFDHDIRPIFENSCLRCHGTERPKSHFSLATRESMMKGGENGIAVIAGQSAQSPLIHYVAGLDEDMLMPPKGKAEPLTNEQIALLRAWIDQGAKWGAANTGPQLHFSVSPTLQYVSVSGNKDKFREHNWMTDGWDGGVSNFEWRQELKDGLKFAAEGTARFNSPDYKLKLSLEKAELGFIRGGYELFRRYYDNGGGYYAPITMPHQSLGNELFLDNGRAWVDVGLTLPDWPRVVLGYEYQFRDGSKSLQEWGTVLGGGGPPAGIFPAYKDIDEQVHIIKFDLSHEIQGFLIEDSFRGEFYDLTTSRWVADSYTVGQGAPNSISRYREDYTHFQGANTFRLEKSIKDWWLVSGGYYYSQLDGDAGFSQETFIPSTPALPPFLGDASNQILIDQRSHIFNANTMLGPWKDLTFNAGLQSSWTRQRGIGTALLALGPAAYNGDSDRQSVEENFGLRYTAIPHTVVFADTRFQQERIGQNERQFLDDSFDDERDFLRDTTGRNDLKDYRGGFALSPWERVSLQTTYRHRLKQNDYDTSIDTDGSFFPGIGYPGHIRSRDIKSDEVEAKLVFRVNNWWKATLKYQWTGSDYRTITSDSIDLSTGNPVAGDGLLAGDYYAHTYSFGSTFTPWRRLVATGIFSYSDSSLTSGVNNNDFVVPYRGGVFNILATGAYVLSDAADLNLSYSFSHADYGQNVSSGVPLGIDYDRHGVLAGVTYRFRKNWSTRLQYGYYRYREPSAGTYNDYTAHAVFATLSFSL